MFGHPTKPSLRVARQVTWLDHDNSQAVSRYLGLTTRVVESPLLTAVNAADRQSVRLVEVPHCSVALEFSVLHHKTMAGPVAVDR